ncbi:MAG TPA: hypothetical protein VK491_12360 [Gemmatimonadaceae bacterium]|nr:hypothetical protein [Gemmatimonadaceae bacterium]
MAAAIDQLYCLLMNTLLAISRVINLIPAETQRLWSIDESEARRRLIDGDVGTVLDIDGSFALVAQDGERVLLARSLDRPLRYFLAKSADGPVLIVSERIDEIAAELARRGQRILRCPATLRHHRRSACAGPQIRQSTRVAGSPRGSG